MNKVHYRHELKYVIDKAKYYTILPLIKTILTKDENAQLKDYSIRSLYFDDYYNSAFDDKEDGVKNRKKYRIRIYNFDSDVIKLECKVKNDRYNYKEEVLLSKVEFDKIIAGDVDFLLKRPEALAHEFFVDYRINLLRPRVIVDYEREAYIEMLGNVRITFDKGVRACQSSNDIFDKNITSYSLLGENELILEIKFTQILPEKVRNIFRVNNYTQQAFSKFLMCAYKIDSLK